MDERQRNELALFRFALIAPMINGSLDGSIDDYLETTCAKTYDVPGVGRRQYSPRTLRVWRSLYQQYGLEGLKMKLRRDCGGFRRLSQETQTLLKESIRHNPKLSAIDLYEQLLSDRLLGNPPCSLSTVQRFLRTVDPPDANQMERKRFVFPYANSCWQCDVCVGPYLLTPERKRQTYLIAFLDDASRLCVHASFFFNANNQAFEQAFKTALLKRGIPQRLYVDNGKIFHSLQLQLICAHLSIVLSHSRPYQPEGRGKIERFFRTVRTQWMSKLLPDDLDSLDNLNRQLVGYIEGVYHNRAHSSLEGKTPMQRFMQDQEKLRHVSTNRLNQAFLHEMKRRVQKDGTISVGNIIFEVPQSVVGQQVDVLFDPQVADQAWLRKPDNSLEPVVPVRPVDNSSIPRKYRQGPIDWSSLINVDSTDDGADAAVTER